jgi:hypothetical protein
LMICGREPDAEGGDVSSLPGCDGWRNEMRARGVLRMSEGLRPVAEATTVRVRGDEVLLTDGPFAETKEQIGGVNLIECADLDEAIEVAGKHPAAASGAIEIRPLWDQ